MSFDSKIATPDRAPTSCQRPMIFTPSPAFAWSCGDIEIHRLRIGRNLSCGMLHVAINFMKAPYLDAWFDTAYTAPCLCQGPSLNAPNWSEAMPLPQPAGRWRLTASGLVESAPM